MSHNHHRCSDLAVWLSVTRRRHNGDHQFILGRSLERHVSLAAKAVEHIEQITQAVQDGHAKDFAEFAGRDLSWGFDLARVARELWTWVAIMADPEFDARDITPTVAPLVAQLDAALAELNTARHTHKPTEVDYVGPKSPAQWRIQFGKMSDSQFRRYRKSGQIRVHEISSKVIMIHPDDVQRFTQASG